jgi:DNA-directed RNA polymerase sigma subunit (sigma70/sigma32)
MSKFGAKKRALEAGYLAALPCEKAVAGLVELNVPFIRSVARRVTFGNEPWYSDGVQDGCEALTILIRRFDVTRGVRLLSYAGKGIEHAIRRGYCRGRSFELGTTAFGVQTGRGDASRMSRLSHEIGEEGSGFTLADVIPDESGLDIVDAVETGSAVREVERALMGAVAELEASPYRVGMERGLARMVANDIASGEWESGADLARRAGVSRQRVNILRQDLLRRTRLALGVVA